MEEKDESKSQSFLREAGKDLAKEGLSWLRWLAAGIFIGALLIGGAGFYYFGTDGILVGAIVGAIAGGLASLWLSVELNS